MKVTIGMRFWLCAALVAAAVAVASAAGAYQTLWGIDEDSGHLFSIADYPTLSGYTDYGELLWRDGGTLRGVGEHIEAFTIGADRMAYFVRNRTLDGTAAPVLMRFDIGSATSAGGNVVEVLGTLGVAFDHERDNITGLAYDPFGQMYGLLRDDGDGTADKLYRIDPATGGASLLGAISGLGTFAGSAEDMVFDAAGHLYVADDETDQLFQVDPLTGAIIDIIDNDLGGSIKVEALAWDPVDNRLLGFDDRDEGFLLISLENGNNAVVGGIGPLEDVEGMAFDPVPLPPAVWLLASGLAGLVALRRRRRA